MIIKQLNTIKLDKIIRNEDVSVILNAQDYAAKIKADGEQIIANANKEAARIKQQVTEDLSRRFTEENAEHLNELNEKVGEFLQQVNEDLYGVIYKVLVKLGIDTSNTNQIKQLISQELLNLSEISEVSIMANEAVITKLKEEFSDTKKLSFEWCIDQSLLDHECICSTKLWVLRLNITTVVDQLHKFCNTHCQTV